jgi:hypothetical protein
VDPATRRDAEERDHSLTKPPKPPAHVRLSTLALAIAALIVIQGASAVVPADAATLTVRLAIPIDSDSPAPWSEAISGSPFVGMIILNPASGPGEAANATYARLVEEAQGRGISVLGYVYTQWADGNVSVPQAEEWIDQYYAWYHVDGIMLDEASDSCASAPFGFYETLYNYIKAEPGPAIVMLNPGEATGECYAAVSDVLLTFEDNYSSYLGGYVGSDWTAGTAPRHFFHIVFGVPSVSDMQDVVSLAVTRGAGWIYVTDLDDSNGNPYSALPSYFAQEVAYVGHLDYHHRTGPEETPMLLLLGLTAASSVAVVVGGKKRAAD